MPSPHQFDHVITAVNVEGEWLYLDSTSGVAPFGYLPEQLRNKRALRVTDSGSGELITTPAQIPFPERSEFHLVGAVDDSGSLSADVTLLTRGDAEWVLRATFLSLPAAQWMDVLQLHLGGPRMESVYSKLEISELSDTRSALKIAFRLEVEQWLDVTRSTQELALIGPHLNLPSAEDDAESGVLKLEIPAESSIVFDVDLPEWLAADPPLDVALTRGGLGDYEASYAVENGRIHAERRLVLMSHNVESGRFTEYESFRAAIQKDRSQTFTFQRETVAAARIDDSEDVELLLAAAKERLDDDLAGALAALERVVVLEPEHPTAWYLLGGAREKAGDRSGARLAYSRQGEVDAFHESTFGALGRLLEHAEETDGAEAAYRQQLEIDPLHRDSTAGLGRLLALNERCEKAADPLRRAVALDDEDCDSRVLLGACLYCLGRGIEAKRTIRGSMDCVDLSQHLEAASSEDRLARTTSLLGRAILSSPDEPDLYTLLARMHVAGGELESTVTAASRALELAPGQLMARRMLATSLGGLQRYPEAAEEWSQLVEARPADVVARHALAAVLAQLNRDDDAIGHLREVVRMEPESAGALTALGVMLYERKEISEAETFLERAVATDAAGPGGAAIVLGRLYAGQERYAEAAKMLALARRELGSEFPDQDLLDYVSGQVSASN